MKKILKSVNKYLLTGFGVLIIILLIINLFTPDHVKDRNYFWYLKSKPQIVTEDLIEKTPCTKSIDNPDYNRFYDTHRKETNKVFDECLAKTYNLRECIKYRNPVDMTGAPAKFINTEKTCDSKIGTKNWLEIFNLKLFVVKTTKL